MTTADADYSRSSSSNNNMTGGGTCEYGNELSGSIKCGEFLD